MSKVITLKEAIEISKKTRNQGKTVVLVGGCFDIIHPGHITFLTEAKKQGDYLFVALENDKNVKRLKGKSRPINQEQKRAEVLAALDAVDYVFILPSFTTEYEYHRMTKNVLPHVIAITEGDPNEQEKQKQAETVGAVVRVVTKRLKNYSTTNLLRQK